MTKREVMQLAIDALEHHQKLTRPIDRTYEAISALKAEQARPEPVPIGYVTEEDLSRLKAGGSGMLSSIASFALPLYRKEDL